MRPEWFSAADPDPESLETSPTTDAVLPPIPYNSMWPDDMYWVPHLLSNRPLIGRADFDIDTSGKYQMLRWWFGVSSA
jgi:8-oxo-dGTP diphosphatase / 2-hydroxy-dATP diphosphatase